MNTLIRTGLAGLLLLAGHRGEADVVILGTRVIFPAARKDVSVQLANRSERPVMVQLWIEQDGVPATPATTRAPFVAAPPLARMDAGQEQTIRVLQRPALLPADRESLFWFNLLEVPLEPLAGAAQLSHDAMQTRIKLIYRPAGLAGDPADAPRLLRWSLDDAEADRPRLRVHNPTPYYVNFVGIALQVDGDEALPFREGGGKVGPYQDETFAFTAWPKLRDGTLRVVFTALSDLGVPRSFTAPVAR